MRDKDEKITEWVNAFGDCVVKLDFDRGRTLFHNNPYCFGSFTEIMDGLDELVEQQWKQIWPNITDFRFKTELMHYKLSASGETATVMMPWDSTGYNEDGSSYPRPGRVTLLLEWDDEKNNWLCTHSHYSLKPGTPKLTTRK